MAGCWAGAAGVCLRRGEPARTRAASRDRHPGHGRRPGARAGRGDGDVRRPGRGEWAHDHDPDGGLRRHASASRLVSGRRRGGRSRGPAGRDRRHERSAGPPGPVRAARDPAQQRSSGLPRPAGLLAASCGACAGAGRAAYTRTSTSAGTVAWASPADRACGALAPDRHAGRRAGAAARGRGPAAGPGFRSAAGRSGPRASARCPSRERPPDGLGPIGAHAGRGGRSSASRRSARDRKPTSTRTVRKAVASRG